MSHRTLYIFLGLVATTGLIGIIADIIYFRTIKRERKIDEALNLHSSQPNSYIGKRK